MLQSIDESKKILMRQAMAKHPGKLLAFCANETSWEGCFAEYDLDGKQLAFYFNIGGATHMEIMSIQ